MEPIELNYVPPPPSRNRGELPGQYHNPPPLLEDAAGWIACNGQMHHSPSQQPPPPPDQSKWQPPGILQMLQIGMHIVGNLIPILHNNLNNHIIHTH